MSYNMLVLWSVEQLQLPQSDWFSIVICTLEEKQKIFDACKVFQSELSREQHNNNDGDWMG